MPLMNSFSHVIKQAKSACLFVIIIVVMDYLTYPTMEQLNQEPKCQEIIL